MSIDRSFDVVVVGAGPAGSVAAYEIAVAGFSVLLVEKHPIIGLPVCCAEGVSHEGLTNVVPLKRSWVAAEITGVTLSSPGGITVRLAHPDAGYVLNREIFDRDLAARATEAGAEVWVNAEAVGLQTSTGRLFDRVLISRDGQQAAIGCRLIIGCDGIESLVGRWAGLDTTITPATMDSAAQYLLGGLSNIEEGITEFYFSQQLTPGGYAWVFPKSATTANVGLGLVPAQADGQSAAVRLEKFVAQRFGTAQIIKKTAGGVPAYRGRGLMLAKNVLLAGDAARLLDSLSGAGIANALLSGMYAGQTAAEYLQSRKPDLAVLKRYPSRLMKKKGRELRFNLLAHRIFGRMTDRDVDEVIDFLRPIYDGKVVDGINSVELLKSILRHRPRLLALARHLVY